MIVRYLLFILMFASVGAVVLVNLYPVVVRLINKYTLGMAKSDMNNRVESVLDRKFFTTDRFKGLSKDEKAKLVDNVLADWYK